jgi:hypothetical protein
MCSGLLTLNVGRGEMLNFLRQQEIYVFGTGSVLGGPVFEASVASQCPHLHLKTGSERWQIVFSVLFLKEFHT